MVLNAKLFRQLSNYTLISRLRVALSGNLIPQSQQAYVRYIACQYTGLESVHGRSLLFQPHRQYCAKHDRNLTPTQIKALIQAKSIFLLDVREPHELVEEGKINGSLNVPCNNF